ncbi:hypothetical protein, partial [Pseudomonas protegens]|uniref:hypothetical protein n=1 Tax=Pseudomonas protegens TaxID=380021 RepID=UPI00223BB7D3
MFAVFKGYILGYTALVARVLLAVSRLLKKPPRSVALSPTNGNAILINLPPVQRRCYHHHPSDESVQNARLPGSSLLRSHHHIFAAMMLASFSTYTTLRRLHLTMPIHVWATVGEAAQGGRA